jgi:hypothetical protein
LYFVQHLALFHSVRCTQPTESRAASQDKNIQ